MEVVTREIELASRSDVVKITPIGDIHIGGRDCNIKLLRACVNKIKEDPNHYWVGMGDYGEYIMLNDPRFDPNEVDENTKVKDLKNLHSIQMQKIAHELDPIKERCLGLLSGNHDEVIAKHYHRDVHSDFCALLQTKYSLNIGYSAILKLRFRRQASTGSVMLQMYAHHGAGGGMLKGAKVNRIMSLANKFPFCDIYAMGHVHERVCFVESVLDACKNKDELTDRPRAFGITGTFKETYTQGSMSYAEKMQYPPTSLGVISFIVKPYVNDKKIIITAHSSTDGLPA